VELVRTASLKGYFEVAQELDLDPSRLLRGVGLSRSVIANPEHLIPARAVIRLLEESAEASGCLTFGLKMAERRELADLGIVSLLVAHQPTLGDALAVLGRYRNRINSTLVLRVEKFDGSALLREVFALDPPIYSRQASDLAIAVLDRICRSVLGPGWNPLSIAFGYEPPPAKERAVYQRVFGYRVEFGSEFDGILIKSSDLDRHNPRLEPALALHATKLVEALVDPGEHSIVQAVEGAILLLMPAGQASIKPVAESLGLNVRTLQRRLAAEGKYFSDLLDRVRIREMNRQFVNRRLRLTDVAHLLGYSSLGAFSRWYGERFNETPSAGRQRLRSTASNN
jgi:AraC-like DNA-binding protein